MWCYDWSSKGLGWRRKQSGHILEFGHETLGGKMNVLSQKRSWSVLKKSQMLKTLLWLNGNSDYRRNKENCEKWLVLWLLYLLK